jgi:hypothetical protein
MVKFPCTDFEKKYCKILEDIKILKNSKKQGETFMAEEPSPETKLSLNHVCKIGLRTSKLNKRECTTCTPGIIVPVINTSSNCLVVIRQLY